jgi:putative ABC transport system ATP-binding protein
MAVPAVRVENVTKRVRDGVARRTVLDDVSFEVARGELVVLRGPSGSGKTTLLALVGGMLSPTSGEIYLDGEPTSRLREAHRSEVRRKKVGFVFQDVQLLDSLSALENVMLPQVPEGVTSETETRARLLLARFGVEKVAHVPVRSLSGGERQRVALARATLFDPPLLVLDEPTAHLDDERARQLSHDLQAIVDEGRAVLVASHDARLVDHPSVSRVLDLIDGRLRGQRGPNGSGRAEDAEDAENLDESSAESTATADDTRSSEAVS